MNREEAKAAVQEIVGLLEEATVPKELWPTVFENLWRDMRPEAHRNGSATDGSRDPASDAYAELARRVNVPKEALADMYALEDGVLAVKISARLLPDGRSAATVDLALLICAGSEASGLDETPSDMIRAVCSHYGRFDSANFASTMKAADMHWQMSGKGQKRSYRLRAPGWEAAGEILRRLTGQE